jgi:hypothetical protein
VLYCCYRVLTECVLYCCYRVLTKCVLYCYYRVLTECVLYCCYRVSTECVRYCCYRVSTNMQLNIHIINVNSQTFKHLPTQCNLHACQYLIGTDVQVADCYILCVTDGLTRSNAIKKEFVLEFDLRALTVSYIVKFCGGL